MMLRKTGAPIVALAIGLVLAGTGPPAQAADFLVDIYGEDAAVYKETLKVVECWDEPRLTTYLLAKDSGRWKRVAKARSSRKAGKGPCARDGYRTVYKWRVSILPDKKDGERWLKMATSGTPYFGKYSYKDSVEVMTASEWEEYVYGDAGETAPIGPEPTASPSNAAPTPTATPTPTRQLTNAEFEYVNSLWDVAKMQPDRQYRRCLSLSDPLMDADSREFYELGAWSGVQLYDLSNEGALIATKLAYALHCDSAFGIKTRVL